MRLTADYLVRYFHELHIKYVIYDRQINSGYGWRHYYGSNPHTDHVHVSVWG
jgi:hypothetical protein